jgi:hypothetical protein
MLHFDNFNKINIKLAAPDFLGVFLVIVQIRLQSVYVINSNSMQ